jgi:hypothetical protein
MSNTNQLTVKPFDEEALAQEAMDFIESNELQAPGEKSFALACANDGPPAAGGGMGTLYWFGTVQDLLEFIANYLVALNPGPQSSDHQAVFDSVSKIANRVFRNEIGREEAIKEFNLVARHFFQIEWWGPREELISGDSGFACETRSWWRNLTGDKDNSPIQDSEMEAFLKYLEEDYGL